MRVLTWLIFCIVTGNAVATVYLVKERDIIKREDRASIEVHKNMAVATSPPASIISCEDPLDSETCK